MCCGSSLKTQTNHRVCTHRKNNEFTRSNRCVHSFRSLEHKFSSFAALPFIFTIERWTRTLRINCDQQQYECESVWWWICWYFDDTRNSNNRFSLYVKFFLCWKVNENKTKWKKKSFSTFLSLLFLALISIDFHFIRFLFSSIFCIRVWRK